MHVWIHSSIGSLMVNLTATNYTHGYYTHAHTLMDTKRIRDKSDGLGPSNKRPRILIIPNLTRQTGIGPPNGYCRQRFHSKRTGQVSNSLPLHRVQGVIWNFISLFFSLICHFLVSAFFCPLLQLTMVPFVLWRRCPVSRSQRRRP